MNINVFKLRETNYTDAGKGCRMWLGDIDGDGRMEYVMVQPDGGIDDRFVPHMVQCATAYTLEGKKLWQIGEPDPDVTNSGSDIPAQIYDIDGDGCNEFICVMKGMLCIFDGRTGILKHKHPLPDPEAHDCIIFADLDGRGSARNIILKNRYSQIWALDTEFNVMWTFKGDVGHYPWVYDLNGDGRDEIIAGYTVLSADGKPMWRIDMEDHADCIWVCDLYENGKPVILVGGADTTAYTPDGRLLWRFTDTVESQNIAPGKFFPDRKGLQIAGLDRIVRTGQAGKDGVFIFDCNAKPIYKEDRKSIGWTSVVTTLTNFERGTDRDFILVFKRGDEEKDGIFDGEMNCILEFPFTGNCIWGDLNGDGINKLVLYSDDTIQIYSTEQTDLSKPAKAETIKQPKRLYNWTRYWGSELEIKSSQQS